jgi:hypothetical protein
MKPFALPCTLLALFAVVVPEAEAQWSTESLSSARRSIAAVSIGDLAFFAGGRDGNIVSAVVDIYDAASGAWTVDTLSVSRTHLAATAVGGYVLFAGGAIVGTPTAVVDVYEIATGTWSTATLSQARFGLAATAVGTKALFAGGATTATRYSAVVDIYDSALGAPSNPAAWSTAPQLSVPRRLIAAATVGSKALFAGGEMFPFTVAAVDIYDDSTGQWSTASLSAPRALYPHASATVGTRAYFAGGFFTPNWISDVVDVFEASTGTWTNMTLPLRRGALAATAVGNLVLFAGGFDTPVSVSDVVNVFDVGTGIFRPDASLSAPRAEMAAVTVGGRAMFAGGFVSLSMGVSSAIVDVFEPIGLSYCGARPNSTGRAATIGADGSASVGANDLDLLAFTLPAGSFAYFLTSRAQGFVAAPGASQGDLCLGGAIGRFVGPGQAQQASGSGFIQLALDLTMHPTPTGLVPVAVGETWSFQAWYRDAVASVATSNFTDGLEVRFRQ